MFLAQRKNILLLLSGRTQCKEKNAFLACAARRNVHSDTFAFTFALRKSVCGKNCVAKVLKSLT